MKQFKTKTEFDDYSEKKFDLFRELNTTGNEGLDALTVLPTVDFLIEELIKDGYTDLNDLVENKDRYMIMSESTGTKYYNYNLEDYPINTIG